MASQIAAFGDLTWDREKDLFCPVDKIGKVDVYLATHHGTGLSGSPAAVNAWRPSWPSWAIRRARAPMRRG
jgi:hypothetical protein